MSAGNRKYPYRPPTVQPKDQRGLSFGFILICAIIAGLCIGVILGLVIQ